MFTATIGSRVWRVPRDTTCNCPHRLPGSLFPYVLYYQYFESGHDRAIPQNAGREALHDCHVAIRNSRHNHDIRGGHRGRAPLAVPTCGIFDAEASHGPKNSSEDRTDARDNPTGPDFRFAALKARAITSAGPSLHSGRTRPVPLLGFPGPTRAAGLAVTAPPQR